MKTTMKEIINLDNINIIDIRDEKLYLLSHVPLAKNIPFTFLIDNYEKVLNKDELYYIYCEFGHKSRKCCEILEKLGYRVVNIVDGYYAYELI